jgi:hypothetical protein
MEKLISQFKKLYEHKEIIVGLCTVLFAVGKFVHDSWFIPNYVEPQVREMSYKLYADSSEVWSNRWINKMPGGFGGQMAKAFEMDKDAIPDTLAKLYQTEKGRDMTLTYLMDRMTYQSNFNTTLILMATSPYNYGGVKMRKTPEKDNGKFDAYWKDGFGKWWKAVYYADEDAYFCFPDYSNGQRIKCD